MNTQETCPSNGVQPAKEISPEDKIVLQGLLGDETTENLQRVYALGKDAGPSDKVTSNPIDDRPKRSEIHHAIRRIFKGEFDTGTNDDGAIIATSVATKRGKNKGKQRGRKNREQRNEQEPEGQGDYLHFTLYKDNRDTMDAVNQLARFLNVKPQVIGYAGTKDRRASTSQRCSVRYIRPRNLNFTIGKIWGVTTGDYKYHEGPIHLGQLRGNEFVITIKNCHIHGEDSQLPALERVEQLQKKVDAALTHMWEHGWINYFGNQRFGTHEVGTHDIGRLILGEKYEEAVLAILHYDPEIAARAEAGEVPEEANKRDEFARNLACMLFLTGKDVKRAKDVLPRRFSAETSIFRHLDREGAQSRKDWVGSLIHITRGLRSMYLHAYQSYMWNHAASKRWEDHGEKVVKGDLVIVQDGDAALTNDNKEEEADDIINPADEDQDLTVKARPLTEEEAASGKFKLSDIVLPTPGYDVVYPDNAIGTFYQDFMGREEHGSLDPHKMRRMRREFSLPGRYRKLMNYFLAKPSVEVKAYADDTEQMHPTDLDRLKSRRAAAAAAPSSNGAKRLLEDEGSQPEPKKARIEVVAEGDKPKEGGIAVEEKAVEVAQQTAPVSTEANKVAVVVKFQLGRSAYATVALRELMGDPPEEQS